MSDDVHRRTVSALQQSRRDLGRARYEFEKVSSGLNDAVAEANRWHDAYEHAVAGGVELRAEQAEQRVCELEEELREAESCVRDERARAHDAEVQRETWEENHQILSEHLQKVIARAEAAERDAERLQRLVNVLHPDFEGRS